MASAAFHRQTNFSGGELAPELYARTDVEKYAAGLRTCFNFIPTQWGALMNRAGSQYCAEVYNSARATRLIPFVFSNQQTFMIEMNGIGIFRFYVNGAVVLSGGVPYTVAHTYTDAELFRVKYAQIGDTIYLAHQAHAPAALKRITNTNWTLTDLSFSRVASRVPAVGICTGAPGNLDTHWVITAVDANGNESDANIVAGGVLLQIDSTHPATVPFTPAAGAKYHNVYRAVYDTATGFGDLWKFGFIGRAGGNDTKFIDYGIPADFTHTPPVFNDTPVGGVVPWDNYPGVIAAQEQRLVLANSPLRPNGVWASAIGEFNRFANNWIDIQDDSPLNINTAALRFDEIRSLVPGRSLALVGSSTQWTLNGAQEGPLTPTAIELRAQFHAGASWLDALPINQNYLFVQEFGNVVRDVGYDRQVGGLNGQDLSVFSRHLFQGYSIVDWCYARTPFSTVWAVRSDGTLLSLTYMPEQQVYAWARHEIAGGFVESIASIPEGTEDAVYMVVRRTLTNYNGIVGPSTVRFVERLAPRSNITDARLGRFLDCHAVVDGRNTTSVWMRVTGTTYTAGSSVTIQASLGGTFAPGDVGDNIVLLPDSATPVRLQITSWTDSAHVVATALDDIPASVQATITTVWGWARDTYSGLGFLEGQTVRVLGDGDVVGDYVVTGGTITLDSPYCIVCIGLPYNSDIELLDLHIQGAEMRALYKNVARVYFEVAASRGLYAGEDYDHLDLWQQRDPSIGYVLPIPLETDLATVYVGQTWNKGGRAVLRQKDPFPLTVLSAIREVTPGGA